MNICMVSQYIIEVDKTSSSPNIFIICRTMYRKTYMSNVNIINGLNYVRLLSVNIVLNSQISFIINIRDNQSYKVTWHNYNNCSYISGEQLG